MKAVRSGLLAAVLILIASVDLLAQQEPPIPRGDRVRVSAPTIDSDPFIGTVVSMDADTLVLDLAGRNASLPVPVASVTSLDVSQGTTSRVISGVLIGGVIGLVVGTVVASTKQNEACGDYEGSWFCMSPWILAGIGGPAAGALLGAGIGSQIKVERWETVPLDRIRIGLTPRGGGLEVSAKFVF